MKYLLLPLALVAGHAMACPEDGAKNATAPATSASPMAAKTVPGAALATALAAKTTPAPAAKPTQAKAPVATQDRVASKSSPESSKPKSL